MGWRARLGGRGPIGAGRGGVKPQSAALRPRILCRSYRQRPAGICLDRAKMTRQEQPAAQIVAISCSADCSSARVVRMSLVPMLLARMMLARMSFLQLAAARMQARTARVIAAPTKRLLAGMPRRKDVVW